jgi:hypothetical protein
MLRFEDMSSEESLQRTEIVFETQPSISRFSDGLESGLECISRRCDGYVPNQKRDGLCCASDRSNVFQEPMQPQVNHNCRSDKTLIKAVVSLMIIHVWQATDQIFVFLKSMEERLSKLELSIQKHARYMEGSQAGMELAILSRFAEMERSVRQMLTAKLPWPHDLIGSPSCHDGTLNWGRDASRFNLQREGHPPTDNGFNAVREQPSPDDQRCNLGTIDPR